MQAADLITVIHERRPEGDGFAVLSRSEADARVTSIPGGRWLADVARADDLDGLGYLGLIIVTNQIERMEADAARHLLARLRDRHAGILLVHDPEGVFPTSDYLALGFEVDAVPGCYVYDATAASRQRDWNNAENWANPENFDKFRW